MFPAVVADLAPGLGPGDFVPCLPAGGRPGLVHDAIESAHARLRKINETRGHFPRAAAAALIWLTLRDITADCGRAAKERRTEMNQPANACGDRFTRSAA
jgi:putative transposase